MSNHHHDHGDLMQSVAKEYEEVLANSEQGVYIYLDDTSKVCNKNFATLLGYKSAQEWAEVTTSFPEAFVAEKSQETLISAYQDAMENGTGSTNQIVWKKKDGSTASTTVILVPISYDGHMLALHFVSLS